MMCSPQFLGVQHFYQFCGCYSEIPNTPSHGFLMFLRCAVHPMVELMTKLHRRCTGQESNTPRSTADSGSYLLCPLRNLNQRHEREVQQVYTIQAFSRAAKHIFHLVFSRNWCRQPNSKRSAKSP
jgi:hypothetical protein